MKKKTISIRSIVTYLERRKKEDPNASAGVCQDPHGCLVANYIRDEIGGEFPYVASDGRISFRIYPEHSPGPPIYYRRTVSASVKRLIRVFDRNFIRHRTVGVDEALGVILNMDVL